jgi:polyvinyl alcohol dehydrogenase (cytochrome)
MPSCQDRPVRAGARDTRRRARRVAWAIGLAAASVAVATGAIDTVGGSSAIRPGPADWPTYGHDAQHTFHGHTTLTADTARTLRRAWFFPTGDAVTATPTVVAGTVYAGSWDGWFYAVALRTGSLRWKFHLDPQPAVSPQPGHTPRDVTSDGGLVTSSAWYEPGSGDRPDLVLFGGGYTLYALNAHTGRLAWKHAYTGRPDRVPDPAHDDTRIFSSPVVADGTVIIGVSVDGARGRRGYVVAARLDTGRPAWVQQTDVDARGRVLNDGCGNVWSSGTVLPKPGLVVFDVADCHFLNPPPLSESVVAFRIRDGRRAWVFQPDRADRRCDLDFGATVNAGTAADGTATFLGVGGKDGTYYALDPRTGRLRWRTNVVFGGFSGGFIATAAFDGQHVVGSTALGDFGRFEGHGATYCQPGDPRDLPMQEPSVHAFDAATGRVLWEQPGAASFGPTTFAGGLTFNGPALRKMVQVRDAATGGLVTELPLDVPSWSGIATVGDALVFGTGTSYQAAPDGVVAYTPDGVAPGARPRR